MCFEMKRNKKKKDEKTMKVPLKGDHSMKTMVNDAQPPYIQQNNAVLKTYQLEKTKMCSPMYLQSPSSPKDRKSSLDEVNGGRKSRIDAGVRGRRSRSHSVGLKNLRNNDYINSIVQCLFAIEELRNMEVPCNGSEFIKSFKELLAEMGSGRSVVNPTTFLNRIRQTTKKFDNYRQQDPYSFLKFVIKEIEENFKQLNPSSKGLFSGKKQSHYEYNCLMRHRKSLEEVENTFVVPCNVNVHIALRDMYLNYEQVEEMFCSECQRMVRGKVSSWMESLPPYLIVFLNRMQADYGCPSKFPFNMTFDNHEVKDRFELFAICNQETRLARFTAKVLAEDENVWYSYEDDRVTSTNPPDDQLSREKAYILFYKRLDLNSRMSREKDLSYSRHGTPTLSSRPTNNQSRRDEFTAGGEFPRCSRAGQGRSRRSRSHSVGLKNSGNNCYINSIIQCLFAIKELRNMEVSNSRTEFMKSFTNLLSDMRSEGSDAINPRDFLQRIQGATKRFSSYKQEDAHLFLMFLIREIDNNFKKLWPNYKGLFSGTIQRVYKYRCFKHDTSLDEVINTFILPCEEEVERAFKKKYLYQEDSEDMLCPCYEDTRKGEIRSELKSLPSYLIILLSRFNLRTGQKDLSETQFPIRMEITLHGNSTARRFELFAICDHHGSSVSYGHYTANVLDEEENRWYRYDDERCSPTSISRNDVCRSSSAYILFYKLTKIYSNI